MSGSYRERRLDSRLDEMVVCAWASRVSSGEDVSHPVMPDGCIDLLFESTSGHLEVVGTMSKTLWVSGCGPTEHHGVRFRPGAATSLLHVDAAEITDTSVRAEELLGRAGRELEARLVEAAPEERSVILESFLLPRIVEVDARVAFIAERLGAGAGSQVQALARELGVSRQYMRRLFLKHTGLTPKSFASIARLGRLQPHLRAGASLARIAIEAGYSDHAHMSREVKRLTGATPTNLFARNFPIEVPSVQDAVNGSP